MVPQRAAEGLAQGHACRLAHAERRRDRRQDERGIGQRREVDEADAIGVAVGNTGGDHQRQVGLAGAPDAGERHQAIFMLRQEIAEHPHFRLAADQARGGHGEGRQRNGTVWLSGHRGDHRRACRGQQG